MQIDITNTQSLYGGADSGLPVLRLRSTRCEALVSLWGAQLLSYRPLGSDPARDLLWMSPQARFVEGQAIRGGIPLCLPWFGENLRDPDLSSHGFVRNRLWSLESSSEVDTGSESGKVQLVFVYQSSELDWQQFPYRFTAKLTMTLGGALQMELEFTNLESVDMPFTFAFHTYFATNFLRDSRITGLKANSYLDNNRGLKSFTQNGDILFDDAIDRVYPGHSNLHTTQRLDTGDLIIDVGAEFCPTVIVWNPGEVQAKQMTDIGEFQYHKFLCLERGAAFDDEIQIEAGDTYYASMTIRPENCIT